MKKYAVIVAGGEGRRAGGDIPKQFRLLDGIPMLWWSVRAFHREDSGTQIRIVMHPGFFDDWDIMHSQLPAEDREIPYEIICGGRSRLESVRNGITGIERSDDALVAVHDAARPLVDAALIARGWEAASRQGAAVPFVPMTDSIRQLTAEGSVAVARKDYVRIQTPQVFEVNMLKDAYDCELTDSMTDDASVAEAAGQKVSLFEGSEANIKVTNPEDFDIASLLLKRRGDHSV